MIGEIEAVTRALTGAGVRYLVVGGVAAVLHGYLRTTVDLDLVIELEEENVSKALGAFGEMGFRPRAPVPMADFARPEVRDTWIREKNLQVFTLWSEDHPLFEVDLFVTEPFDFAAAYRGRSEVRLGSSSVAVVGLRELIEMKRSAARPRDLEDVAALEALVAAESGEEP